MTTFARCSNDYLFYGRGLGCNMLLPPPHPYRFIIKLLSLYNMLIFIFLLIHRKLEKNFLHSFQLLFIYCISISVSDFSRKTLHFLLLFTAEEKGCACRFFENFYYCALNFYLLGTDTHYFQMYVLKCWNIIGEKFKSGQSLPP